MTCISTLFHTTNIDIIFKPTKYFNEFYIILIVMLNMLIDLV